MFESAGRGTSLPRDRRDIGDRDANGRRVFAKGNKENDARKIVMKEGNPKNWKKSVQHPSEDDLLCYIDGELSPKFTESLRSHLEACWHCRNRAEKFQAAISLFIDYRSHVVQPLIESRNNWSGFDSKLRTARTEIIPPSLWQRWRGSVRRMRVSIQNIEPRVPRLTPI